MKTEQKVIVMVAAVVAVIYFALYYSGNFNIPTFLQGFGENLAAFIIVAGMTYLLVRWGKNRRSSH